MLTVLSLGLRASWQDAFYLFREPSLLLRSMLSMTVIMPLVAATLVVSFNLPVPVPIALVALAVSPVPPLLPKKELKAGGHASYAVGLLVAIALLSIITVPVVVSWFISAFERTGAVSPLTVAAIVSKSVLAPLVAGMALCHWAPALADKIARPIALLGTVLLVATALPLAYASWPAMQKLFGNGTVLIIAAMAVAGLGIGHLLGGPNGEHRTVLALSTTSRHPGIALAAAVAAGGEAKSVLSAILLYVIVAVLVSVPYVAWRKRQSVVTDIPVPSSKRPR
jgi:BASS family bile acid:Na+ symporter